MTLERGMKRRHAFCSVRRFGREWSCPRRGKALIEMVGNRVLWKYHQRQAKKTAARAVQPVGHPALNRLAAPGAASPNRHRAHGDKRHP